MAIVKVAEVMLLLLVASVAVIHGFGLRRYAREAPQRADCGSNITVGYCQACVNPELECYNCPDGHIPSSDKKACIKCPDDCEPTACVEDTTAPGTARCNKCKRRFTLQKSGICAECGYYCDSCELSGAGKCDKDHCNSAGMEDGVVYSNESNTCLACPTNCLECLVNGPDGCDVGKCGDGTWYDSDTKKCKGCSDHCQSCLNSGAERCDAGRCDSGYFLDTESTSTCLQCDPRCTKCDKVKEAGKCDGQQYCDSDTFYDESTKTCKPCAEHCESCIAEGASRCDENKCKEGYGLLKPEFVCDDCPPNCKTCAGEANSRELSCTQCVDSYEIKTTLRTCDFCPENCQTCTLKSGKPWCDKCYESFTENTNNGKCEACPDNCEKCTYTGTTTRCKRDGCKSEYVYKVADGTCNQCALNCLTCSYDIKGVNLCQKCEQRYILSDDSLSCKRCPDDKCLECRMYDGELKCMRDGCESGYYNDDGRCTGCTDSNCDICDADTCYVCKSSPGALYALDSSSGCQQCVDCKSDCTWKNNRAECGECEDRYMLDDNDRSCTIDCPDYCNDCELDDNNDPTCTKTGCFDRFFYAEDEQQCVGCPPGCDCTDSDPFCWGNDIKAAGYVQAAVAGKEYTIVACPADCKVCEWDDDEAKATCTTCKDGWYKATDNSCKRCATGCLTCKDGKLCTECKKEYGPKSAASEHACELCASPKYCVSCLIKGPGECDQCNDGYYYDDTTSPSSPECKECKLSKGCICESGPDSCDECMDDYGFNFDNTTCIECKIAGCKKCHTSQDNEIVCDECKETEGYFLDGDTCRECLKDCDECENADVCTKCKDGYGPNPDNTTCTKCPITKCDACTFDENKKANCEDCKPDYRLVEVTDTNCIPCPYACWSCALSTSSVQTVMECTECKPGYALVDKTCFPCVSRCKKCSYTNDATKTYTTCEECEDEYTLASSNRCEKCPDDCLSCKWVDTKTVCDYGKCYDRTVQNVDAPNRECKRCPDDCNACTYDGSDTHCLPGACDKGFYFDPSPASRNVCRACDDNNCDYCDEDGCWEQQCETGYGIDSRPSDLSCYPCGDGCDECTIKPENGNRKASCRKCKPGYEPSGDICKSCGAHCTDCSLVDDGNSVKCSKCEDKYALNDDTNTACERCPSNCDRCTYDSRLLRMTCDDGKCEPGFAKAEDGSCEGCVSHCKQCSAPGKCDTGQCHDGYALKDEKCELCGPHCEQCDEPGECNRGSCNDTYAYSSTTKNCLACPSNCMKCTVNSGLPECDTDGCEPGYGLQKSKNTCVKCPFNCEKCSEWGKELTMTCDECFDQYVINDGDCGSCPRYCLKCSESKDGLTCTQCNNGTTMITNGTCQPCPEHCQACSHTGDQIKCNADRCDPGYGRSSFGQCEECSTLTFAHCTECTDASPVTAKSECSACDEGYALSEDSSSCTSCSSLSCAGGPCQDRLYVCKDCNVGYNKTEDDQGCGIECYTCDMGTGCDGGPLLDNDNVTICPIGDKGVGCWMELFINEDGTEVRRRGCMTGNENHTCSDAYEEKKQCITLEDGQQFCRRCCRSHKCNTDPLSANSVAMIASVTLLIIMVFVAMVMPDERRRV